MSHRSKIRKNKNNEGQVAQVMEKKNKTNGDAYPAKSEQLSPEQKRISELETQLKQALSDYQILKRDMEKRLQFEGDMVRADVLRSILEIADDMDMALSHKDSADVKAWREGMVMILHKIQTAVKHTGARKIEIKVGDVFNPCFHEAVGVVHEGMDGTIAQIIQSGYILGDKVIRPVRVIVHTSKN